MRRALTILLVGFATAATGCGDDDGGGTDSGAAGDSGGGGTQAPVITRVDWLSEAGCTPGTLSPVQITVSVEDADTTDDGLVFTGSAIGCTGDIDGMVASLDCPHAAPYTGSVTVVDPDGNSDDASFMFGPCETGGIDF